MSRLTILLVPCLLGTVGCREPAPVPAEPAFGSRASARPGGDPAAAENADTDARIQRAPFAPYTRSNVSQFSLDHLFSRSKRIVVRKSEVNDEILYESNKKPDLALLRQAMTIAPPGEAVVPCRHVGAPIIEFYFRKQYIGWVALHDNTTIRTSFWNTDAEVADKQRLLKWFDRRGIAAPRRRAEAEASDGRHGARKTWPGFLKIQEYPE